MTECPICGLAVCKGCKPGRCYRCSRTLRTASEIDREICLSCLAQVRPLTRAEWDQMYGRPPTILGS